MAAVFAVVGNSACDEYVGPDYLGESLAVFSGEITAVENAQTRGETSIAILWSPDQQAFEGPRPFNRVVVEETFPASFRMEVHEPPPADAFFDEDARLPGIAFGYFVAIDGAAGDELARTDLVGMVLTHSVIYVGDDVDMTALAAAVSDSDGELTRGYNLISLRPTEEELVAITACTERAIDLWSYESCVEACVGDEPCLEICDAGPEESERYERCGDLHNEFPGNDALLRLVVDPSEIQALQVFDAFFPAE